MGLMYNEFSHSLGRLRKSGGCDPAGIQGCISHDESLVLVYSTAQRLTELGNDESRPAKLGSSAAYEVRRIQCKVFLTKLTAQILRSKCRVLGPSTGRRGAE